MNLKFIESVTRRSRALPLLAVVLFGALIASCSKESGLLESIPSDVDNVGTLKLKSIFGQAGIKFTESGYTVESGVQLSGRFADYAGLLSAIDRSNLCDIDDMAWAKDKDGNAFMTALIGDEDGFIEATSEQIKWADGSNKGFRQGEWSGQAVLVGDGHMWITGAKDAAKFVADLQKRASKSSVASLTGVVEWLEGDGLLNAALRKGEAKSGDEALEGEWAALSCDVKDNKLVARSVMMQANGKVLAVKGLQPINPAVLGYVPGSFNVALALGLTPDFDWSVLTEAVGMFGGFQARGMLSVATPFLQSINGTVLLAAGPANDEAYSEVDPGNWQFILMAHLPQDKVKEIMNMIRTSMFMAGIAPRMTDDGLMIVPQYGLNLYVGNVDGYFAISNIPFDPSRQNSLAPLFVGKEGAVSLEIPSLRVLDPSAPAFGFKLCGQTGEGTTTAELALTGTSQPILQALLSAVL